MCIYIYIYINILRSRVDRGSGRVESEEVARIVVAARRLALRYLLGQVASGLGW